LEDLELREADLKSEILDWAENVDATEVASNSGSDDSRASATTAIDNTCPKSGKDDFDDSDEGDERDSNVSSLPVIIIM